MSLDEGGNLNWRAILHIAMIATSDRCLNAYAAVYSVPKASSR